MFLLFKIWIKIQIIILMKKKFIFIVLIFFSAAIFAQTVGDNSSANFSDNSSDFLRGEELFKQNKAQDSLEFLKRACASQKFPKAYIYLSLAYFQLGDYQNSLAVCEQGMNVSGTDKKVLSYNAGNTCFVMGDYENAEKWYSLAISANSLYSNPVLNRANTRLKLGKIQESIADYKRFLELEPNDKQRPQIEKLLSLLDDELVRLAEEENMRKAEEERLKAEEARIAEQRALEEAKRKEEERIAAEKLAAEQAALRAEQERLAEEEAERRRKLLEDVASSLQNTQTENMSAGAEGTFDYGYETELE